ncbi:hypothetical protein TrRE_jg1099, partial [Triparma retinervis]
HEDEINVMTPKKLSGPWGRKKIVAAAVGKSHTILVDSDGKAYGAGRNSEGQCGINTITEANVTSFKPCKVGKDNKDCRFAQVSAGENFTVAVDEDGLLYSCGNSEYGTLGNGSTGERLVKANKISFNPSPKFVRRDQFVKRDLNFKENEEPKHLDDSHRIRIAKIACGKFHTVALEAARPGHTSRVFTWGCGNYGSLGHKVQKDEYYPRLVETLTGPIFSSNQPIGVSAGATCFIVSTAQGHCYYSGKHKTGGEATMTPSLLDFLANNSHSVSAFSCGSSHVALCTTESRTVTYGQGPHGELGLGRDGPKSSAAPKFVDRLDDVDVKMVGCGYGHTVYVCGEGGKLGELQEFQGEEEGEEEGDEEGEKEGEEEGEEGKAKKQRIK